MCYEKEYANNKGKVKRGRRREGGMEKDDRDGLGGEKMDRGEVKTVDSDEVERFQGG